ncbi:hypothetical protein Sinac_4332 [Singulisphaera acidiphila DSM 18658]|uniref:Uncharacterized protein n=1 Tax=Singulisphaera acidiphila (strain ATCC BAA-1392 / DSM 18658 / VKM B-2454 / MOB10) TaxID=886293 RepID=L0DGM2_SINAD|nr:hypothetical protein Sinac_4332 [Singulisphaera acidiphila DSM 18658]
MMDKVDVNEDAMSMWSRFAMKEGAAELEIASLEKWAGTQLPRPYLDLLMQSNDIGSTRS